MQDFDRQADVLDLAYWLASKLCPRVCVELTHCGPLVLDQFFYEVDRWAPTYLYGSNPEAQVKQRVQLYDRCVLAGYSSVQCEVIEMLAEATLLLNKKELMTTY